MIEKLNISKHSRRIVKHQPLRITLACDVGVFWRASQASAILDSTDSEEAWRETKIRPREWELGWKEKWSEVLKPKPRAPKRKRLHCRLGSHNIKWDHFEILATGRSDIHCRIKESLLIKDLKPSLNENVGSEKLFLY